MGRAVIHADLDAFYASVEQLDNPELRGRPVVVGGAPEQRGVVAAASYEAREFGVRSAMPMSQALRRCPDAVRVPARFDRYRELSGRVMSIFRSVTPLVEPLSLDEAFLDVTERVESGLTPDQVARLLKDTVRASTGLTVSIGAGSNKTVAKIASDMGKPDGLVVVAPGDEFDFLAPLPVRRLSGVGPKAEELLARAGIHTIGELASADEPRVERLLGSRGPALQRMARGEDDRPVEVEHERKSIGAETTFAHDLPDGPELRGVLRDIAARVAERVHRHGVKARTVVLKLRYADFRTITRQTTLEAGTHDGGQITRTAESLLDGIVRPEDRFRLLGVSCTHLVEQDIEEPRAISFWPESAPSG